MLLPLGAFWLHKIQNEEQGAIRIAVCAEEEGQRADAGQSDGGRRGARGSQSSAAEENNGITEENNGTAEENNGAAEKNNGTAEKNNETERNETERGLGQSLAAVLTGRSSEDGLFQFYECEDEQQVREEVASRRAECGFVIGAGLKERLDGKDYKRAIRVYSAPSTIAAKLASETVFAAMIELYDRDLFVNYVEQAGERLKAGDLEQLSKEAGQMYSQWLENGSTFHFTYEIVGQKGRKDSSEQKGTVFPVRGIVAVYVFVAGLYGAVISLKDEKKGLFLKVPYGSRTLCCLAAMAAPVFLAAVSGLTAVRAGDCSGFWGYELAVMAGYGVAVTLFSWGVRVICRREELVGSLIPFFLAGSLIFCPVFLDMGKYMPELRMWGRLFLPGYYMRMF